MIYRENETTNNEELGLWNLLALA